MEDWTIRKQDRGAITGIQLNKMQNTLNTLERDIDTMWFTQTMCYVHLEIASPFITVQKYEGIQPTEIPLNFLFTLSPSLSHNHRDILQYNTIPYIAILQ